MVMMEKVLVVQVNQETVVVLILQVIFQEQITHIQQVEQVEQMGMTIQKQMMMELIMGMVAEVVDGLLQHFQAKEQMV
jgi:hypothetical protein